MLMQHLEGLKVTSTPSSVVCVCVCENWVCVLLPWGPSVRMCVGRLQVLWTHQVG